ELGDLDLALARHGQALGPYRRVLGDRHPATAAVRSNLGVVHTRRGELDAARRELSAAVAILMTARGPHDPWTLQARGNLGSLLTDLGDVAAAESTLRSVLADARTDAPARLVAITRNNLAHVLHLTGRTVEAAGEYAAALSATVAQFGASHVESLIAAQNVAQVLADAGDLAGARARLQALVPLARENGEPLLLSTIEQNLGALLGELATSPREFDAALALTGAALERRRSRFGAGHPSVARTLEAQALVTWMSAAARDGGEAAPSAATAMQQELLGILRRHFHANLDAAESDLELLGFLATVRPSFDAALSMAGAQDADATAFGDVLAWQGAATLAETAWRDARRLEGRADPATRELWRRLRALERARAAAVLGSGAVAAVDRLAALEADASALRQTLEARVPGFAASRRPVLGTAGQVCDRLRASGAALLDYVRFERVIVGREAPRAGGPRRVTRRPTYDVFTVVPDAEGCAIVRTRIGDAATVDGAVSDYRDAVTAAATCGPATCGAAYGRLERASEALWKRLVAPVLTRLPASGRVYVVPDGRLVEVAFGTLMNAGRFAVERWSLPVLPAPGALLHAGAEHARSGWTLGTDRRRDALVVGDVDYDRTSARGDGWGRCDESGCGPGSPPAPAPMTVASLRSAAVCGGPGERRFASLTPTEATEVAPSLVLGSSGVTLALGAVATEAAVRAALEGKRVVHLATHGFYATAPACAPDNAPPGLRAGPRDPLRLSALVLAGANPLKEQGSPAKAGDDGLLTARDISLLDLAGTDLVSLSACETALGTAAVGEGALGLARAFGVAGAGAVIASLWEVGNDETTALFTALYPALAGGAAPEDALRAAQLALIETLRAEAPETRASAALWGAFQVQVHRPAGAFR
ncbi:MAG: CHAT domain-containing protein, partial [Myxococcales bacterium]|nr:CHAT domain-containing protein [Myxococcales bacterium]